MGIKPRARKQGLFVKDMPEETLVYDLETHKAHCLNRTAALVWKQCDGKNSIRKLSHMVETELDAPVGGDELVWLTLQRLGKSDLLEEQSSTPPELARVSRRDVVRRLGLVGGLTLLLPLVTSVVAPTPAEAATTCVVSCVAQPDFTPCNPPACVNVCIGGSCV